MSASNAWAVGGILATNKTLIFQWNGTRWNQLRNPNPRVDDQLGGVATAPSSAWAVGSSLGGGHLRTLILHRNGTNWN